MDYVILCFSKNFIRENSVLGRGISAWVTKHVFGYRKDELFAAVKNALTSLENKFQVRRNDQDLNTSNWKKVPINRMKRHTVPPAFPGQVTGFWSPQGIKTYQKFNLAHEVAHFQLLDGSKNWEDWSSSDLYGRAGQSWEMISYEDNYDPSEFILGFQTKSLSMDQWTTFNQYTFFQDFKSLEAFAGILNYIFSEQGFVDQISEAVQKSIEDSKRKINRFFHAILVAFSRNYKFKTGIGRGVEGYIPFMTWARGSLESQLVKPMTHFIDRLSQPNNFVMEMSHGY